MTVDKGTRFGKLVVLKEVQPIINNNRKIRQVLCQCDCGNKHVLRLIRLTTSNRPSKSCGCKTKESATKHGLEKHPLYNVWSNMMKRCYNETNKYYHNYGGRGIKVCKEWKSNPKGLINFIKWAETNGYKLGLDLDRYPNKNGGYKPSNCRFVTRKDNNNNRRDNVIVTYKNKEYTFSNFWHKFKKNRISYDTARRRFRDQQWSAIEAVTKPSRNRYD